MRDEGRGWDEVPVVLRGWDEVPAVNALVPRISREHFVSV